MPPICAVLAPRLPAFLAAHNGHSARHEQVARQTPWPTSSPFCGSLLVVEVGCPD
jgi:hypothetical protein